MYAAVHALNHGTASFVFVFLVLEISQLTALIRNRVPLIKLLLGGVPLSILLSFPLILVVVILMSIVNYLLDSVGLGSEIGALSLGTVVTAGVGYMAGWLVSSNSPDNSYRRGARVARAESKRDDARSDEVTLAGIPVAMADETKHFKFIGTTGTGKSTAIREVLSRALCRGDRAVITDPDAGYLENFYSAERGDIILNPFDPDSMKWHMLGEIQSEYDVDQMARSLIPDSGDPDRTWTEYARTFFTAVVQTALKEGIRDDSKIYYMLTKAPVADLKTMLANTAAAPFLEVEKMFGSTRSVTSSAVRALQYVIKQQGTPFSIREWVKQGAAMRRNGKGGGALFIPYKAGEIVALRSVISAWMRIAIFAAMDQGVGDQRLWFVVDELDALGEIDGLKDALARLRKFGGRTILGLQSIAQVSGTYGRAAADTIVENCGNTLILRCSASERGGTSEFASKLIGQTEVLFTTKSTTDHPGRWFESTTTRSEHVRIEPAVMASEIERLTDLEGYLKFASIPDWRRVRLTPVRYPTVERSRRPDMPVGIPATVSATSPAGTQPPATAPSPVDMPAAAGMSTPAKASATTSTRPKRGASGTKRPRKSRAAMDKGATGKVTAILVENELTFRMPDAEQNRAPAEANGEEKGQSSGIV